MRILIEKKNLIIFFIEFVFDKIILILLKYLKVDIINYLLFLWFLNMWFNCLFFFCDNDFWYFFWFDMISFGNCFDVE